MKAGGASASTVEEALERAAQLLEAVSRGEYCCLRHGLPYVTPSLLASQAFCEMKLHLSLERGDHHAPPGPSTARQLLAIMLRAKKRINADEALRGTVVSIPLAALVEGVPLVGRPPALALRNGCVRAVYLPKISRAQRLYNSDIVKGYAYAATAQALGLLCSDARLVYILGVNERELLDTLHSLEDRGFRVFEPRPVPGEKRLIVKVYDEYNAAGILSRLLAYWRGDREPQPRPGKWCNGCGYRELCPVTHGNGLFLGPNLTR